MEQLSLPALDPDAVTQWYEGPPPMIGWWDTLILDNDMTAQQVGAMAETDLPIHRRWWGGPSHKWSIAVNGLMQGRPMIEVVMNPMRPLGLQARMVWRGRQRLPTTELTAWRYPLKVRELEDVMDYEELGRLWVNDYVDFPHLRHDAPETTPATTIRPRVRVSITPPSIQAFDRRHRVKVVAP